MDALDVAPPDMASDDLQTAIVAAQNDLARAGDDPFLRGDPLRLVLTGLSAVLGVFGRSTRRWERAVADVLAARDPVTPNDRAAINQAVEDGAYKAIKQEVRRLTRTLDRKLAIQIGLAVGGALVVGLVVGLDLERWALTHPDISNMHCADQPDHSRVCWFEVIPAPTQPTAPQPTPGKH